MGKLQSGRTWEFKIGDKNWFLIAYIENNELYFTEISSSSRTNLKRLIRTIVEFEAKGIPFEIIGVWHGERRTDLFLLCPEILKERIEREFGIRYTTRDLINEINAAIQGFQKIMTQLIELGVDKETIRVIERHIESLEKELEVICHGVSGNLCKS